MSVDRWAMGELIRFIRQNNISSLLRALSSREVHPALQFIKYAICGAAALTVHLTVATASAKWLIPGLESNCPNDNQRAMASLGNNGIAFLFSNALVYWLNTKWVFTQGRHNLAKEFLLFSAVNLPGAVCGGLVQYWLTRVLGWPTWAATFGFVLPNVLVNFLCRKFFIFKN